MRLNSLDQTNGCPNSKGTPQSFMPKPVAKIQNVQAMRGIASMMVVIFHIANLEARTYPDRLLGNFFQLGEAGVDVFFVISGFVMSTITRGNFGAASSKIFLLKRIVRIYPIYWFYTSILMFFWLFMPAIMTRSGHAVEHMSPIHSYLLIPYCEVPLIGHAWSLVNEMYFYVVFSVLLLRPEKERWFWILIWALTIPLIPTWLHTSSAFALVAFDPLTLEFVMGCGIAILIGKGFQRFGYFSLFIGLCLFFVKPSYHSSSAMKEFSVGAFPQLLFSMPSLSWRRMQALSLPGSCVFWAMHLIQSTWPICWWQIHVSSYGNRS